MLTPVEYTPLLMLNFKEVLHESCSQLVLTSPSSDACGSLIDILFPHFKRMLLARWEDQMKYDSGYEP